MTTTRFASRLLIINLAAATIMHDDPTLSDWRAASPDDRELLIIDYRDEFASSPFPPLADARISHDLIPDIARTLNAIAAEIA